MPARSGEWSLLDRDSDPVAGDPDALSQVTRYYSDLAQTITSEAVVLKSVTNDQLLKGKSADAMREHSHTVADDLVKVSGRYQAVYQALTSYHPTLVQARDESWRALQQAIDAQAAASSANAMPNPAQPPAGQPPLTADQISQVTAHHRATSSASDSMNAAKNRLLNILTQLDDAGRAAAKVVSQAWGDGLTDSGWDKFVSGFMKFVKVLVNICKWVGMVLAVISIILPGVGFLALVATVAGVATLAGSLVLTSVGEGTWTDVLLAAVSVIMIGAGALVARGIQVAHAATLAHGAAAIAKNGTRSGTLLAKASPGRSVANFSRPIAPKLEQTRFEELARKFPVKPNFWQVRRSDYWSHDLDKLVKNFTKDGWTLKKWAGLDRIAKLDQLQKSCMADLRVSRLPEGSKVWKYVQGGRTLYSNSYNAFRVGASPLPGVSSDHHGWQAWEKFRKSG